MKGTSPSRASRVKRRPATKCHDGKCELSSTHSEGEVHGHCYRWNRSRQERLCVHGVDEAGSGAAEPAEGGARQAQCAGGGAAAVHHRHGGVLGRAPLGAAVPGPRPHRAADGAQARHALPHERQARQERRGRRGGDLRSRAATEHALRAGQERGAAVAADGAPRTTRLRRRAHRVHQPHPRPAQRVRRRAAAEGRGRARARRATTWKTCPATPTP